MVVVPKDTLMRLDSLKSISDSKRQQHGGSRGEGLDQIEEDDDEDTTPKQQRKPAAQAPQGFLVQKLKNQVLTAITQLLEDI
jgi:hypothetical protein